MAKKIGIFGGSFNPPHIAHLIIAETIRDQFSLDQIIWIPNYIPPHKSTAGTQDAQHRLHMVGNIISGHEHFTLSTIEIDRKGTSYMLDTISMLQETQPDALYYLIIGGDSLNDFMTWYKPLEILKKVPLIVYNRTGIDTENAAIHAHSKDRISYASAPLMDISSTVIRERVAQGRSIRYLVTDNVRHYILKHNLYT